MSMPKHNGELGGTSGPHFVADEPQTDVKAWEEVDPGRFLPRRIRGSCKGRALG